MSKQTDIIQFDESELVRKLCGPNHANLALIEDAFDVYVEAPGASVHINGDGPSRSRAAEIVREIYQRLERGWPCGINDVRALIKAVGSGPVKSASAHAIIPFPRRAPIVPKTPRQEVFIKALQDNTINFGVGPAGTGKTFLAAAYGASLLARGEVSRFIACRPAVEAGERLGFLPGDFNEKVDPYMQPIWDSLNMVLGREDVERRRESGEIEVVPLAFMRGRTLADAFVQIDEAQNATIPQMKMVLTRLGERANMRSRAMLHNRICRAGLRAASLMRCEFCIIFAAFSKPISRPLMWFAILWLARSLMLMRIRIKLNPCPSYKTVKTDESQL